jgi:cytochrome c biogenesis protein CcmG/thiol:disulfide interchange protein DsbE
MGRLLARIAASAAAVAALGTGLPAPAATVRLAAPAPDFRITGVHGAPLTLERFRGRPLYINVFASWCPPCRVELPGIVAAARRYAGRVVFLGVDAQEPATIVRRFHAAMNMPYAVAIDDGPMAIAYGATSLPESVFIDRHGVVRAIVHGPIGAAELHRNLDAIAEPAT